MLERTEGHRGTAILRGVVLEVVSRGSDTELVTSEWRVVFRGADDHDLAERARSVGIGAEITVSFSERDAGTVIGIGLGVRIG